MEIYFTTQIYRKNFDAFALLVQTLGKEYPEYYRLKYNTSVTTLKEAQKLLTEKVHSNQGIGNQSVVLNYFEGDSSIYVFVIGKEDCSMVEIKKDFPLETWIRSLLDIIYDRRQADNLSGKAYNSQTDSLVQITHLLYKKLFAPVLEKHSLPQRIIISPDGVLGYLPFEVLLSELPENNTNFRTHHYLINDYEISYVYSVTLLQEMQQKTHGRTKGDFIAFAPHFGEQKQIAGNSLSLSEERSGLGPLFHNISEVKAIQHLIGGKVYIGSEATEENFIREAPLYKIVHLATHAKANDQIGDYAFLAFAKSTDSLDNVAFYNRDLYNLQIQSDMVVLSACETGIGELRKGEGIISLARGFSYAGAKSLVTSLWRVNDAAAQTLMERFYSYLKDGKSKDAALRQAKLDYIRSHLDYEAHPFFWATFVAMGDMSPLSFSSGNDLKYWLGPIIFLVAIAIGIWWRYRRALPKIRA